MKLSGSDKANKIFFSAILVLGFLISAAVLPYTPKTMIPRVEVKADLLFAMCIVCGIIYDNRKAVSVMALVTGVMCDIFITPPSHLSPILFLLGAYYSSKTVAAFTRTNAFTAGFAAIPFFLLRAITGIVFLLSGNDALTFGKALKLVILPEFAVNVITVIVVYFIIDILYKFFKKRFYI